jgi:regulatory protein
MNDAAFAKIVRLTSIRERSSDEMLQRLAREGFTASEAIDAVNLAKDCGLIDDKRFTEIYVRSKLNAGWGAMRIEKAIGRYGIFLKDMPGYPEQYFEGASELDRAIDELSRFRSRAQNLHEARWRRLIEKGYDRETARSAIAAIESREASACSA